MPIVDYLVLTALDREWDAIKPTLSSVYHQPSYDGQPTYYTWIIPYERPREVTSDYLIAAAPMARWTPGSPQAATFVTNGIHTWDPDKIILLGIAGSLESDRIQLGDVVVSESIYGYDGGGNDDDGFHFMPTFHQPSALDLDRVRAFKRDANRYKRWQEECRDAAPALCTLASDRLPELHIEATASGSFVVRSKAFAEQLKHQINEYISTVEMEGQALYMAVYLNSGRRDALMIRGISDYADAAKKSLAPEWQSYASANAGRLLRSLWATGPKPISPRYKLNLTKGRPELFVQQQGSGGRIRDIRFRGVGTQHIPFPEIINRPSGTNPKIFLTIEATLQNGYKATGFRGLFLIHTPYVAQIECNISEDGTELYVDLPSSPSGLRGDLLLSFPSACQEIVIKCNDDFGRNISAVYESPVISI